MHDTGLANRIRAKGVTVVEVAGWKTRGRDIYAPRGAVHHHTAGAASGAAPSLTICIFGRPDVPGPLCQVLQSREQDAAHDKAYVIAAGRANHAGLGGWRGLSGNTSVGGVEVEHTGMFSPHPARHETTARILAALIEAPGSSRDAGNVCQHFEWAPTRKIDFRFLAPYTANWIRDRVEYWVGRTIDDEQEDWLDMATKEEVQKVVSDALVERNDGWVLAVKENPTPTDPVYYTNFGIKVNLPRGEGHLHEFHKALRTLAHQSTRAIQLPQSLLDEIPTYPSG